MPRPTGPEVRYRTLCVLRGMNAGVVACACRSNNNERYNIVRVVIHNTSHLLQKEGRGLCPFRIHSV